MADAFEMPRVKLGSQGFEVSKLGFGCMGLSRAYNTPVPEEEGIAIIKEALKQLPREKIQLATKFGICTMEENKMTVKGTPEYALDYIDLYYVHRIDTTVPIEETMGELKKLVEEGKIKYIGLSEAHPETIRRAHAVHPITAVQQEYSLWTRDIEDDIIPVCRFLYTPLHILKMKKRTSKSNT
ncbi:hypothetical protein R3W88_002766 [Solanum pinnatisectum]|uniref:NADP-dependent oxidoreductase domain-containing protein n=1 Tax=Solanum pinnatisectum TaxID=50273 RepID=A0AAV9MQ01_9SOLN|nr:hypothetical protein R3W88_002766 [Solanum pinnatisectum]